MVRQPLDKVPEFGKYSSNFSTIATDVLAATLPLICLGFVTALFNLDDEVVNPSTHRTWLNTIIAFASVFPIAFTAIIGRLTYQVGRYNLERGTTVGFLEQMLGSRTFGGAILTQITLGTFNLLGVGLVALWVFSPLGTQALLRTLYTGMVEDIVPLNITYRDTMSDTGLSSIFSASVSSPSLEADHFGSIASTMASVLRMPDHIRLSAMDPWDNVKIPFFTEENDTAEMDKSGWRSFAPTSDQNHEHYSALVGVQIEDVPAGNTTLTVESTYIDLDCYNVTTYERGRPVKEDVDWEWRSFYDSSPEPRVPPANANSSWQGFNLNDSHWMIAVDHFVDVGTWTNRTWLAEHNGLDYLSESLNHVFDTPAIFADEPGVEVSPTKLYMFGWYRFANPHPPLSFSAYCDVRQKYVETQVLCERREGSARHICAATAQRPSMKKHASELISFLNFPGVFEKISEQMPAVGKFPWNNLIIDYLAKPSEKDGILSNPFENVDKFLFGRRLSQMLNTYIFVAAHDFGVEKRFSPPQFNRTTNDAKLIELVERYQVSRLGVTLSFICCGVFLLGGIASILFTHLSAGPEVLGYASTLLRDSRFVDLPPGSSRMNASDLSKAIQEYRVRYGKIQEEQKDEALFGVGLEDETTPIQAAGEGQGV